MLWRPQWCRLPATGERCSGSSELSHRSLRISKHRNNEYLLIGHYEMALQALSRSNDLRCICNRPPPLLWAGSRVERGNITVSGIYNRLNYCLIFILLTQLKYGSGGRIIQPSGTRVGDPCNKRTFRTSRDRIWRPTLLFNREINTTLTFDKSPPQKYADNSKKQNRMCNASFLFYVLLHSMAFNSLPPAH